MRQGLADQARAAKIQRMGGLEQAALAEDFEDLSRLQACAFVVCGGRQRCDLVLGNAFGSSRERSVLRRDEGLDAL